MVRSDDYRLAVGTVLGGRFEIAQLLGEGGMGAVYRGVDKTSGARVAIKVIRATSTRQLDALRRFIREAGAAATLTHPAVVRMIHVDVSDEGLLYQVQELVDGETLTVHLTRKWPPGDAARLCAVLADALADAHARGVVHRDVKPDNVMLTTTAPGLKLLDFGIAKLYDAVTSSEHTTRGGGLVLGTPAFMAPEQVSGEGEVGDRADVYAVGLILFRLLTARGPFEASSPQEMMMRHVIAPAPDVRTIDAALPEPLALLVARTLAKEPKQRPTAAELAAALDAFADAAGAPLASSPSPRRASDVARQTGGTQSEVQFAATANPVLIPVRFYGVTMTPVPFVFSHSIESSVSAGLPLASEASTKCMRLPEQRHLRRAVAAELVGGRGAHRAVGVDRRHGAVHARGRVHRREAARVGAAHRGDLAGAVDEHGGRPGRVDGDVELEGVGLGAASAAGGAHH